MRRTWLVIAITLATTAAAFGGLERGNRLFRDGRYAEAVEAYRAALEDGDDSPVLRYNLGTALLQLGRYAEAEEQLRAALAVVEPDTRQFVYYNLGQRFLEDARQSADPGATATLYDAAIEAYRQALRLRPADRDAKWNYELALQEREEQPPQQGGGGGDEDQQDQDPQPGDQGTGGQTSGREDESPRGGSGEQTAPMTQEQAERILSAVEQDERELFRERLRKGPQQTQTTTRDW